MSPILDEAKALLDRAWAAVEATSEYQSFKVLKTAVDALKHQDTRNFMNRKPSDSPRPGLVIHEVPVVGATSRRISQADAAAFVLHEAGPLPTGRLLEAARAKGATIGGSDPLANFRSALSKDEMFHSVVRNSMNFWWFKAEPLPSNFYETEELSLDGGSPDSSESDNQEGGDGHDPATT